MDTNSGLSILQEAIEGYIPALFSLIIFALLIYFNELLTPRAKRNFLLAVLFTFLLIIVTTIDYFMWKMSDDLYVARRYVDFFNYAFSPLIYFFIALVNHKCTKKEMLLLLIPEGINIVLAFGSIYGGYMFYVTSSNVYDNGPLFFFPFLVTYFYFAFMIYLENKKGVVRKIYENIFLVIIISTVALMTIFEMIFKVRFIIYTAVVILLVLYYSLVNVEVLAYDPLTGARSHTLYDSEVKKVIEYKRKVIVVMIDMNGLKEINDHEGHLKGDEALKMVVKSVTFTKIPAIRVYRVGGDEFVIIARYEYSKAIKENLEKAHLNCGTITNTIVTFAFGVASYDGSKPYEEALVEADDKMYKMKDKMHKDNICK
jgi:diguanylate cyclase (GGDEF)-like protein